jgi:sugar/nucleoside kinase (ribokinase family)
MIDHGQRTIGYVHSLSIVYRQVDRSGQGPWLLYSVVGEFEMGWDGPLSLPFFPTCRAETVSPKLCPANQDGDTMTILVVGDANADLSATLSRFPREGDDVALGMLGWGSGGSAATVAAGLALLGAPARLVARVGRDPAAEVALRVARDAGVDLGGVQHDATLATGLCFAAISPGGERTFFSFRGANVALALGPNHETLLDDVEWLHIAGHALLEGPQRDAVYWLIAARYDRDRRIPISLDLCLPTLRTRREEVLKLLPDLDILFANQLEVAALFPALAHEAALAQVMHSNTRLAVLKLGPRGCMVASARQQQAIAAFPVDAIDTNGCGDAFVAAFLYAHLHGATPIACAALANAMGALTATRPGAAEALPDRERLRVFLGDHMAARLL